MKKTYLILFLLFLKSLSFSQFVAANNYLTQNDSINQLDPREKIFIHYDKPYYKLNDTLWLRGYIIGAFADQRFTDSSKIVHIDIWNNKGTLIKRISSPSSLGIFYNNITLSDLIFTQGNYTLRAYTNYMRNFGDSLFFTTNFKIIDPLSSNWNIKIDSLKLKNNKFTAIIKLMDGKKNGLINQKTKLVVRSENRTLLSKAVITDSSGDLFVDTTVTANLNPQKLVLDITELDEERTKFAIPITSDNKRDIDLQFLPEGGSLIANINQRVAFNAIDIYGHGIKVKGVIKDAEENNIVSFQSTYKGFGFVNFLAIPNKKYFAYLDNGTKYSLPVVKKSGRVLSVYRNNAKDSLIISIGVSQDLYNKPLYFAATVRGVCYAKGKINVGSNTHILKLSTENFPTGVAHFTLYDEDSNPVNERSVFIWHRENTLDLSLISNKPYYANKDSVALTLKSTNAVTQEKAPGSFSISVVDTGQIPFPINTDNLLSYIFLSSDITGKIEDPGFYVNNPLSDTTDLLMLTQGWVNYNFSTPKNNKFAFEKNFSFGGKVTNAFNKPIANSKITLLGKDGNSAFLGDTITGKDGRFRFDGYTYFNTDSVSVVVKALNKRGKSFNTGIDFDSVSYPVFKDYNNVYEKDNIVQDTFASFLANKNFLLTEQAKRNGKLENVTVTTKTRIPGSHNLNKNGGSDLMIADQELSKTPNYTLLDLLRQKIPGFTEVRDVSGVTYYTVKGRLVRFIFDGIDLNFFTKVPIDVFKDQPSPLYANITNGITKRESSMYDASRGFASAPENGLQPPIITEQYLQYYAASDIKGIELMFNDQYINSYVNYYLDINEKASRKPGKDDFCFIEITTYGGVGPFLKKIPGVSITRLDAPYIGKQFYSPKYISPESNSSFVDLRSTIYWNPNIITDKNGIANFSFYTSESKSSYLMILQGTDMKGNFGVLYQPITIEH